MIDAPTAAEFCSIITANRTKVVGHWSGSAFRDHPVGIFRERMIFANYWNTNNYCDVKVMIDPDATLVLGCQESGAHGNPYPKASSGDLVTVYRNGQWVSDGPWCEKIVRILADVKAETAANVAAEIEARAERTRLSKLAASDSLQSAAAALTHQGDDQ